MIFRCTGKKPEGVNNSAREREERGAKNIQEKICMLERKWDVFSSAFFFGQIPERGACF